MTRLAALLTATLLMALPAAPAVAQSAGDEQYTDPFAGSGDQTTSSPPAAAPAPAPAAGAPASPPPAGAAPAASGAPTTEAAPSTLPTRLANTGADPWVIALLGAALLLLGLGLRLRTADARS